uniref:RRM domain-containing protein n=1 Tax=Anopheles minimus TaxID=112268 RepID=A0A182WMN9_9DIPT
SRHRKLYGTTRESTFCRSTGQPTRYRSFWRIAQGQRLLELPPYVTEHQVKAALAEFGEVLSVTETVYGEDSKVPGVKTGIRLVKIILNTPTLQTGPTITVGGERTTITY